VAYDRAVPSLLDAVPWIMALGLEKSA
jgi:hypothetical protein